YQSLQEDISDKPAALLAGCISRCKLTEHELEPGLMRSLCSRWRCRNQRCLRLGLRHGRWRGGGAGHLVYRNLNPGELGVTGFRREGDLLPRRDFKTFRESERCAENASWLGLFDLDIDARHIDRRLGQADCIRTIVLDSN